MKRFSSFLFAAILLIASVSPTTMLPQNKEWTAGRIAKYALGIGCVGGSIALGEFLFKNREWLQLLFENRALLEAFNLKSFVVDGLTSVVAKEMFRIAAISASATAITLSIAKYRSSNEQKNPEVDTPNNKKYYGTI